MLIMEVDLTKGISHVLSGSAVDDNCILQEKFPDRIGIGLHLIACQHIGDQVTVFRSIDEGIVRPGIVEIFRRRKEGIVRPGIVETEELDDAQ